MRGEKKVGGERKRDIREKKYLHFVFIFKEQCQCKLSLEAEEIPDSDISASCGIILSAEEKESASVTSLKQLHGWQPQKKNKIAAIALKGTVIVESSKRH